MGKRDRGALRIGAMRAIKNAKFILKDKIITDKFLLFDKKIIGFKDNIDSNIEVIDAHGLYVSAGFIDIHIHGSGGADVMDATPQALSTIAQTIIKYGTTSFVPTTMTMSLEKIKKALDNIKLYTPDIPQASILGVHMEGPFINPNKTGAQDSKYIIPLDLDLIDKYSDIISIITLAPEMPNALQAIKTISTKYPNIILSIGHSNASYEQSKQSFDAGITHATHLFNDMSPYHHRDVGIIGAVFQDDRVSCDIIADTIHTHHSTLHLTYKQKQNNLLLITDSMRAGCMKDGTYDLGGQQVSVCNNKATLLNGVLAGSVLTLDKAVKNMIQYADLTIAQAVSLATYNPAKKLNLNKGLLHSGYDADIVIFDDNIDIQMSIVSGDIAYKKV
jgi:N-acetylglucosamine-6-phosphate deacetylase